MAKNFAQKRLKYLISTIMLIIAIIAVIGVASYINYGNFAFTRANPTYAPLQLEISNLTENSATISWTTLEPTNGFVTYQQPNDTEFIARDVRDIISDKQTESTTHWVNITGLQPNTTYDYTIQSNESSYREVTYQFTTRHTANNESQAVANGTILDRRNTPKAGIIIIATADEFQPISTLTDQQGNWQLNLNLLYQDNDTPFIPSQDTRITLRMQAGMGQSSQAVLYGNQLSPAPTLQVGQTYDFTSLHNFTDPEADSGFSAVMPVGALVDQSAEITIWNPQENEALQTSTPVIMGTAPADTVIELTLNAGSAEEVIEQTFTDSRGNWQWATPQLATDDHIVTASFTDEQGITTQTEVSFSVISTDSRVAQFEASPSASLTPTSTTQPTPTTTAALTPSPSSTTSITASPTASLPPTSRPSPTTTYSPTPTQTAEVSPTNTPTSAPTATPTTITEISPTKTPTPTPIEQLPQAGTSTPLIVGLSVGSLLVILAAGLVLL